MRAVDSPYIPGSTLLRRCWYTDSRIFKWSPRYKESDPHVCDGCQWREDVMDYQIVIPPGHR